MNAVERAANVSIPLKKPTTKNTVRPIVWWNQECSRAIALRRTALRKYREQPTYERYLECKRTTAYTRRLLKSQKKISWMKFCSSLNKDANMSDIWNKVKIFNNKNYNPCHSTGDDSWLEDFTDRIAPPTVDQQPSEVNTEDSTHFLCSPFTLSELKIAIKKSNNSAPGYDNVCYPMLTNLPEEALHWLLWTVNDLWAHGEIPETWLTQIVIPILKPGKDPANQASYRPITLSSCILKTLERMIKLRLEWWMEFHHLLPCTQSGFRRGRSTYDNHALLTTDILSTYAQHKFLTALFLDVSSAYDNVRVPVLIHKLQAFGLPIKFTYSIYRLLQTRWIYIRHRHKLIGPRRVTQGLPQGAVLSPLLYIIYTQDLETIFAPNIKILQFADDICLYCTESSVLATQRHLDKAVGQLDRWLEENGLDISESKSNIVIFSRKRTWEAPMLMTLHNHTIRVVSHARFLGLTYDSRLTWSAHVAQLIPKLEQALNVLRAVTRTWWGADPNILLTLYRTLIRSKIDYGSIFYHNGSKISLRKLDRVQFRCIRVCVGAMMSTPTNALLLEASEPPLNIRRQFLSDKYLLTRFLQDSPPIHRQLAILLGLTKHHGAPKWLQHVSLLNSFNFITTILPPAPRWRTCLEYEIPYSHLIFSTPIHQLPTTSLHLAAISSQFTQYTRSRWPNALKIYTDGSKTSSPPSVGCAYYCPDKDVTRQYSLPPHHSIFTAEATAISQALTFVENSRPSEALIISDSLSVLSALQTPAALKHISAIQINIIRRIINLLRLGIAVNFLWIPAHVGILHNEFVDKLAKEASQNGHPLNPPTYPPDYYPFIKQRALHSWNEEWSISKHSRGRYYALLQPQPRTTPWFSKWNSSRRYITSLVRMRFNHGNFTSHLYRIGVTDSPYCPCDGQSIGDLNHLFFACFHYQTHQATLLKTLLHLKEQLPLNIQCLLASPKTDVYKAIIVFLCNTGLKI